jgi:hypothetical protein
MGVWPYQWLFAGPNSRPVMAWASNPFVGYGTAVVLASYQVPEGMRFSLRGVVAQCICSDFSDASGNVTFNLAAQGVGTRNVEGWGAFTTRRGSTEQPFPITGRLEFQSRETVLLTCTPVAVITLAGSFGFGMLVGHEYPNSEAGDD